MLIQRMNERDRPAHRYANAVGTTGPFRGRKRSLYDGGVRMPFIIAHPGPGRKGAIEHTVVGAVDWLPTVLSLAGVSLPAHMGLTQRGHDISDLILAPPPMDKRAEEAQSDSGVRRYNRERPSDKPLLWEWRYAVAGPCWNDAPQLAARLGRFKLYVWQSWGADACACDPEPQSGSR